MHELVHWAHDDDTSKGCEGSRIERRCRRRTALLLIDPAEYALAERMWRQPHQMASELNVTVQVIEDYRQILSEIIH